MTLGMSFTLKPKVTSTAKGERAMYDQGGLVLLVKQFKDEAVDEAGFYERLTELITTELGCSRASLWLYSNNLLNEIEAIDLYDSNLNQHFKGAKLSEEDFGPYFESMRQFGSIDAGNAFVHPATSCFTELYFEPNNIFSLLDIGIRQNGQLVGVFCCEHVGDYMHWNDQQKQFLEQAGKLIAFALKSKLMERFSALFS